MSADERKVNACTECDSCQVEIRGTNIRSADGKHYVCRNCGHRMDTPKKRTLHRTTPDKPSRGLARLVWEQANQEAD